MSRANPPNASGSRKISFNVSEQYDIQDVVGEGAYGVVWYVGIDPSPHCRKPIGLTDILTQLRDTQAFGSKSGHQEDYALRPLHVLPENTA